MRIKKHILFVLIIALAFILRVWSLDTNPAGLNADEAALGYNAYSLLQTGKDEYGESWPLAFKSFGDYKPGLYAYFTIPFIAFWGLNEWAVRFPSALLGVGTVILIYFLSLEIFQKKSVALISSLFLATVPWHLHFSRGGWETNAATFFVTLGVLLFIKSFKNSTYLFWALISFLVSMYSYQSPRLVVPVLCLVLFVAFFRKLVLIIKSFSALRLGIYMLALVILSIPLILQLINNSATARFDGLSIFSDSGPSLRTNELRGDHQSINDTAAKLFHNKITSYGVSFLGHYLDHFSLKFFFIEGDSLIRNKVPEQGQFFRVELLFLIIGLWSLAKTRLEYLKVIFIWFLIAPLASSLTYQTPHALRSLSMVVPLTLIMAFGFYHLIQSFRGSWRRVILGLVSIILIFEVLYYLDSYYLHYPKQQPLAWEYGFKEMVSKLEKYEGQYQNVIITDKYDQPYILVLFFKQYDPRKYQPQAKLTERDKFNFGTVRSFDKYQFKKVNPEDFKQENTLFVVSADEIVDNIRILDTVYFPNNKPAFIFATKL